MSKSSELLLKNLLRFQSELKAAREKHGCVQVFIMQIPEHRDELLVQYTHHWHPKLAELCAPDPMPGWTTDKGLEVRGMRIGDVIAYRAMKYSGGDNTAVSELTTRSMK